MSDYAAALDRARDRADAERAERYVHGRARMLLDRCGWSATEAELAEMAAEPKLAIHGAEDRSAAVARALSMQTDERYTGRRIRPEDVTMGTTPGSTTPNITPDARARMVEYAAGVFIGDDTQPGRALLTATQAKFDVTVSEANWYATYMPKVRARVRELRAVANGNGTAAAEPAALPVTADEEDEGAGPTEDDFTVDDHCEFCGEFESDCECGDDDETEPEGHVELTADEEPDLLVFVQAIGPGRVRIGVNLEVDYVAGMQIAAAVATTVARLAGARVE